MKVLLIEDEDLSIESTSRVLRLVFEHLELSIGRSRDEALAWLSDGSFDLIICDLKIPATALSLNVSEEHGKAVHTAAREIFPGTPISAGCYWPRATGAHASLRLSATPRPTG